MLESHKPVNSDENHKHNGIAEEVVKEEGAINDSLISEGLTGKEDTAQVLVFKNEIGLVFLP